MSLKLWVKLGCSPRFTQMVPKWALAGQLAGTDFGNACKRGTQTFLCGIQMGHRLWMFCQWRGEGGFSAVLDPNPRGMLWGLQRGET